MLAYGVVAVGVLIGLMGLWGIASPAGVLAFVSAFKARRNLMLIGLLRLGVGGLFLWAAPSCRMTLVVRIVGGIAILSGLMTLLLSDRLAVRMIDWWARQSPTLIRLWAVVVVAFGALLIYAGMPPPRP